MSERAKTAKSALWSAVEKGGLVLLSVVSLIVYSRFLSASDFGLFSIVFSLVELGVLAVSMLFHDALVQKEQLDELHYDTAFSVSMLLGLLLFVLACACAPLFARITSSPDAARLLPWTALSVPFTAWTSSVVARERRMLSFRALALRSLIGRAVGAALGIVLVAAGAGYWGLVAQQVLVAFISSFVLWSKAPRAQRPRFRIGASELRSLSGFGSASVGVFFLNMAIGRVFTILVGVHLGTAAAGYLNLSLRTVDVLWSVAASAVTQVALPVLSRLQTDPLRLRQVYRRALELSCLLLYPCFFGMAATAPELVALLYGEQWLASVPYVCALSLLVVVRAPKQLVRPLLTSVGLPQHSLIGLAAEVAFMVLLSATLGLSSLTSVIIIWAGRELIGLPVMALVMQRVTPITLADQLKGVGPPLLASAGMCAAVLLLRMLLPAELHAAARLSLLVPCGVLAFLSFGWCLDRKTLERALEFASSALRRVPRPNADLSP